MSTAAVLLDIEKASDTTWQLGLLYKLSKLQFLTSLIKLISSCLSQRKFRVLVEGEISKPRCMQAGMPQGSNLSPTLHNLYINDTTQTSGMNLIIGLCILLRVYQSVYIETSIRNNYKPPEYGHQ
jgi:hypothetical protein